MAESNGSDGIRSSSLSWQTILDEYEQALKVANKSQKTIDGYLENLKKYFGFLETEGSINPIPQLGKKELMSYISSLQNRMRWPNNPHIKEENREPLSPFTVRAYARDIKTYWSWLRRNGYIENNSLAEFTLPSVPDNLVEIINPERFKILLSNIDRSTPEGERYYCIMVIFYDTGMRLSELRMINIEGIDLEGKTIKVMGKGQRERLVPIVVYTRRCIMKYLNEVRSKLCPENCPYLFADSYGDPMAKNRIEQFMRRLLMKSGLKGIKLSPHILRHSSATLFLANGGSITDLQAVLGHKSPITTQRYTHLNVQDIQQRHAKFSPVSQLFRDKS
jgi:site-specific recombinase XerD